jgi:hypothetical protein
LTHVNLRVPSQQLRQREALVGGLRERRRPAGVDALARRDVIRRARWSVMTLSSNRHPALAPRSSMIFSENRYPLFGIML